MSLVNVEPPLTNGDWRQKIVVTVVIVVQIERHASRDACPCTSNDKLEYMAVVLSRLLIWIVSDNPKIST